MKNNKWLYIAIIAAAVVLAALLVIILVGQPGGGDENKSTEPNATQQDMTDNITLSGEMTLEDSEFDDSGILSVPVVTDPAATAGTTEPGETVVSTEPGVTVKPTEPDETEEPTEPDTTEKPTTKPELNDPEEPEKPTAPKEEMTYEVFRNLTPAQQRAFEESFSSKAEFFEWYNAAKDEYEAANPPVDVGDGKVDMDEIFGKN